jgi:hypothetical protein
MTATLLAEELSSLCSQSSSLSCPSAGGLVAHCSSSSWFIFIGESNELTDCGAPEDDSRLLLSDELADESLFLDGISKT